LCTLVIDKPLSREESLAAFEELFIRACPKFINANPPPYDDPAALALLISPPSPSDSPGQSVPTMADPMHRHLNLFLADVAAQSPVPTLRSFLKLYTSLGAKKLANFLDADEEEMVQEMMMMKQVSRSISRIPGSEKGSLLDGQTISTSDLNFVIDKVGLIIYFIYIYSCPTEHGPHC
jgi:translation initiation factor 3 subunit L